MKSVRPCPVNVRRDPFTIAAVAVIFVFSMSMTGCMISRDSLGGRGSSEQPQTSAQFVTDDKSIQEITGQVSAITDGDTIFVVDENQQQHKVHLAGVDSPEGNRELGERARQNLFDLVYGKTVHVLTDATEENGRLVGKVMLGSCDVNLEQIKSGYARFDTSSNFRQIESDRKAYTDAEVAARNSKLNVWSKPDAVPAAAPKQEDTAAAPSVAAVVGNKNSLIYHWAGCSGFTKVALENRVAFSSWQEAEKAGFRAAKNCSSAKPGTKVNEQESATVTPAANTRNGPAPTTDAEPVAPAAKESKSDQPAPVKPASNSSGYILGPRGGCYRLSESGRKVYVDRSLCQ